MRNCAIPRCTGQNPFNIKRCLIPNYDYRCTECNFTVTDVQLPIDERKYPTTQPCPKCLKEGTIELCVSAPGVSYTANGGGLKTPDSFKDILRTIKKKHRGSTINV